MDFNITVITIIYIIILIIPGVFFKRFYFQRQFSQQFGSGLFSDRLLTSLFWGIIVQIFSYWTFSNTFNLEYDSVRDFLMKTHNNLINNEFPLLNKSAFVYTLYYMGWSIFISMILGYSLFRLIRKMKLDLNYPVFSFSNRWHYYFTGEIVKTNEFKSLDDKKGKISATIVDVLLNYGEGKNQLFSGNLTNYSLCPLGNLETLYLTGVIRYKKNENGEKPELKDVPGDCFVVPYKNVLNMNVQYILDESKVELKSEKMIHHLVKLLVFFFLSIAIIYPWFTDVSFLRKLFGMIFLFFSWLFLFAGIVTLLKKGKQVLVIALSTALVFLVIAILILRIEVSIYDFFPSLLDRIKTIF